MEGALSHPGRIFEDPADGLDEACLIEKIQFGNCHRGSAAAER
jgi:hypothetical protein